ncbi:TonB-linked outer membrane protein, SusC/RagA family [Chitinophaga sp. YR573]|uniref:SusC/RagA family TonB-linked outer membrane protein n=1 Tax=Chitinophaga sp. YR573 TaxID=1881040 RepID=UPI0008D785D7|nr:TonB-dependent receptor [Chitinophaga sp. YR573]SEW28731.1 TonB-linked outer membrane protein, SusC/RagA family [Chitinophaga sp. YR573]
MKQKQWAIPLPALLLFVLLMLPAYAFSALVKGIIKNTKGEFLAGVTIKIKGTNTGTLSKEDGSFQLQVPAEDKAVLEISYMGYQSQEIALAGRSVLQVTLTESASGLNEVLVIGYGTQKKVSTTAAVSSVGGKDLAKSPVPNISNSLAGRVAGVSMRPNGGRPGADNPDIHIRGIATTGNNGALIVIDGIIRNNINEIPASSIASVTVLKDAAAVAPYGLGGANGVLLITTKKGLDGPPQLSLNAYYGVQTPTYYPSMLNAQDYMRLHNEAYLNENPTGTQLPYTKDLIDHYATLNAQDPDKYPISNTKDLVHLHAPMQNYTLQLSGGSPTMKYFVSLGYLNQSGMFDPVNYHRYDYTVNLEVQATKTTTVNLSLIGAFEQTHSVDTAISVTNLFRSNYKFIPIANLRYSNGLWGEFAGNSPIGMLNAGYLHNDRNTLLSTISVNQQLPFIPGLSAKGSFSFDPTQMTSKGWHTPFYFYSQDLSTTPYTYKRQISTAEGNAASYTWLGQKYAQQRIYTFQGYLNYQRTFGKHDITGLVVAEARKSDSSAFSARRNNFGVNIDELGMGSSDKSDFDNGGSSSAGSQIGFVYRVGYSYAHKYLLEASGRYDGHYYFAPGKRWGYFPAFSAGWVLSEEKFLRPLSFINYLKVRGSWGKSGNLAGTPFQYLQGYLLYGNAYAYGTGTMVQGSYVPREANPNITWEISNKTDIGFETSLWKGLLDLEVDYFHERRTGMLLPPAVTVPIEYGLGLSDENEGIMENHGIEITVATKHEFSNGLHVGISGNFSYARNKMLQIFETSATRNNPNRSRTGRPFGTPFGYHAIGLFSTSDDKNNDGLINAADGYNVTQFGALHPGDIKYADLSGPDGKPDGKIDANDETRIGNPVYPFITYGFTPTASWKGLDLSLFFQGSAMSSFSISGFQTIPFNNNNSNSAYEYYNNRWTPDHQNAKYPRANQSPYANNTQVSDFWMANTALLRLKTVMLGYTLPDAILQRLKIKALRVYVSGQNMLTFSKLKFMDPEVGYTDGETAYPNQKVYVMGMNVTF